jgi:hypothetical protein
MGPCLEKGIAYLLHFVVSQVDALLDGFRVAQSCVEFLQALKDRLGGLLISRYVFPGKDQSSMLSEGILAKSRTLRVTRVAP